MLIEVLLVIIVLGVLLYLVNTRIPMDSTMKTILNVVVVLGLVIWFLDLLGFVEARSIFRRG